MPVVPSTDSPPTMPSRAFIVFSARRSPPGIAIVTVTSGGGAPFASARSSSCSRIIARGAGLIAGSPTASGRPGRVTVPTPSPARKRMPRPGAAQASSATISAPCVTSGSSPASLTMPARARAVRLLGERQRKARRLPAGQADRDRIGKTAGQQRRERGARRGGRAGPGRPAAPQRRRLIACHAAILEQLAAEFHRYCQDDPLICRIPNRLAERAPRIDPETDPDSLDPEPRRLRAPGYSVWKRARAPRSMPAAIRRSMLRRWRINSRTRNSSCAASPSTAATSQASA